MQYNLIFNPELQIDPSTFESLWNKSSHTSDIGPAYLEKASSHTYDPAIGDVLISGIMGITTGVMANVLYDFVKNRFFNGKLESNQELVVEADPNDKGRENTQRIDIFITVKMQSNTDPEI